MTRFSAYPVRVRLTPSSSVPRMRRGVLVLAVFALVVSACGVTRSGSGDARAATVTFSDGSDASLSIVDLNTMVSELSTSDRFAGIRYQGGLPADVANQTLAEWIVAEIIANESVMAGATVEAGDIAVARDDLLGEMTNLFGGDANVAQEVAGEVETYLTLLAKRTAAFQGLADGLAENAGPGERSVCSRHILLDTEEEAQAAIARIDGGEDFAALAQELSTGPSGPNGGDLGCGDPAQFVPEFAEAITNGAVGETLGPVETQFGFHVIRVDGYQADGLADARIADGLSTAVVDVDEFYGVWNADSGQVIPT